MRIKDDLTYDDLGLVQPEGGSEIGEKVDYLVISEKFPTKNVSTLCLIDKDTGENFNSIQMRN